jgi:hypothetical protein
MVASLRQCLILSRSANSVSLQFSFRPAHFATIYCRVSCRRHELEEDYAQVGPQIRRPMAILSGRFVALLCRKMGRRASDESLKRYFLSMEGQSVFEFAACSSS